MEHREIAKQSALEHGYPSNVVVHGNGFVQIELGGTPETRLHIWTEELDQLTQNVNTRKHNHRFGFVSTVLRGAMEQQQLDFLPSTVGEWQRWRAQGPHGPKGNRLLVRSGPLCRMALMKSKIVAAEQSYSFDPILFHETVRLTPVVVTLMTKTRVIPEDQFQASVFCRKDLEPDQEYSRFQIPWEKLRREIIAPALGETPFRYSLDQIFR